MGNRRSDVRMRRMKYPMEAFVSSITVSDKEEEKEKVQLRGYEAENFFFFFLAIS